ncbi:DUF1566 domain-containing protein [Candidatus Binatia bacterium]|nr:DUF1566 domain-containing protein [Candidatus Binatia bacterium]
MALAATLLMAAAAGASAATDAQSCRAAIDKAAGKFLECRLKAESTFASKGDAAKRSAALDKCGASFGASFGRSIAAFGAGDCPSTPQAAFDEYLTRCSDDTVAAARGGTLPAACGDGAIDAAGEHCDGADLGGDSCASLGFASGTLGCTSACRFDTSACDLGAWPVTGQTKCWSDGGVGPAVEIACPGTGQDGETQAGATLAFVDNGDGTVTDANTGLTWEKKDDAAGTHDKDAYVSWADAFTHVAALNAAAFAGHTDWRVPNVNEIGTLPDYGRASPAMPPAFNDGCTAGCVSTSCSCSPGTVWSSTTLVSNARFVWIMTPTNGESDIRGKTSTAAVLAVRGRQ